MSVRSVEKSDAAAQRLAVFTEIENYRGTQIAAMQNESREMTNIDVTGHLDGLTETERSAAQLGVSADEWKPISFMNQGHYGTLLRGNALSGNLAQKLEAYKEVASGCASVYS